MLDSQLCLHGYDEEDSERGHAQILIVLSSDALTRRPEMRTCREKINSLWPCMVLIQVVEVRSHILSVLSSEALARSPEGSI